MVDGKLAGKSKMPHTFELVGSGACDDPSAVQLWVETESGLSVVTSGGYRVVSANGNTAIEVKGHFFPLSKVLAKRVGSKKDHRDLRLVLFVCVASVVYCCAPFYVQSTGKVTSRHHAGLHKRCFPLNAQASASSPLPVGPVVAPAKPTVPVCLPLPLPPSAPAAAPSTAPAPPLPFSATTRASVAAPVVLPPVAPVVAPPVAALPLPPPADSDDLFALGFGQPLAVAPPAAAVSVPQPSSACFDHGNALDDGFAWLLSALDDSSVGVDPFDLGLSLDDAKRSAPSSAVERPAGKRVRVA